MYLHVLTWPLVQLPGNIGTRGQVTVSSAAQSRRRGMWHELILTYILELTPTEPQLSTNPYARNTCYYFKL